VCKNEATEELEIRISPTVARRDAALDGRIRMLVLQHVLPMARSRGEHFRAQVEIRQTADGNPECLVVYMLRMHTYTADVYRVDVDRDFNFIGLEEG